MFYRRLIPKVSDEQHIDQIRKAVRFWDAWRSWLLVGSAAMLVVLIAYLNWLFSMFADVEPGDPLLYANVSRMWLLLAFIVGTQFGMSVYEWLAYVTKAIVGGCRTERLLLEMYDANADEQHEQQLATLDQR